MAREVVVTLEEDEDSGRFVALPSYTAHGGFLCYSKTALSYFTATRSVYFYGIMQKTSRKYINETRHRYLTPLTISPRRL